MTQSNSMQMDPADKPATRKFKDSTELLDQPEKLRARAEEDGFLFFKGLLKREEVIDLRMQILQLLQENGYLEPGYDLMEAVAHQPAVERHTPEEINWNGVGVPMDIYEAVQKMESFHALQHHPKLIAMYEKLFGEAVFPHPRNIARVMLPHPEVYPTPPHQDFLHIQGATNTWTSWIPLGDVPAELGGLCMMEGSHNAGLLGVTADPGAGGLESILCGLGYEWSMDDYEAGDVMTFHSYTVHKSLPNQRPGRVRLSCDFRYQPISQPIGEASLLPHGPFEWEKLYEGWERKDLQFFWKDQAFQFSPFDESIRWQKEKIC